MGHFCESLRYQGFSCVTEELCRETLGDGKSRNTRAETSTWGLRALPDDVSFSPITFFSHSIFDWRLIFRNEVVKKKYLNAWKSDGGGEEYVYSSFFQLFLSPSLRSSMCRLFVVALLGWFTNSTVKSQTNKQNAGVLRQLLFLFRVLELGDGITRSDFLPIVFIVLIAPIVGFLYQHYFK